MNKALPKVSVVTITYGHEKYITETLDGVLMQQYDGPVEFIIANDNSPDATDEVVKKYFLKNPAPENFEIKYTKHDTNKGMMPNFIWALEQATGQYIALCEGDDYWSDKAKLQKQVDFLENNSAFSMIFSNAKVLIQVSETDSNTNRGINIINCDRVYTGPQILEQWTVPTATVMFRKTALQNYLSKSYHTNPNFLFGDIILFLSLAEGGSLYGMSEYFAVYRRHEGGATNIKPSISHSIKFLNHLLEIINIFGKKYATRKVKKFIGTFYLSIGLHSLKYRNFFKGIRYIVEAFRYNSAYTIRYFYHKIIKL